MQRLESSPAQSPGKAGPNQARRHILSLAAATTREAHRNSGVKFALGPYSPMVLPFGRREHFSSRG